MSLWTEIIDWTNILKMNISWKLWFYLLHQTLHRKYKKFRMNNIHKISDWLYFERFYEDIIIDLCSPQKSSIHLDLLKRTYKSIFKRKKFKNISTHSILPLFYPSLFGQASTVIISGSQSAVNKALLNYIEYRAS